MRLEAHHFSHALAVAIIAVLDGSFGHGNGRVLFLWTQGPGRASEAAACPVLAEDLQLCPGDAPLAHGHAPEDCVSEERATDLVEKDTMGHSAESLLGHSEESLS